jgi:hypothetical protein
MYIRNLENLKLQEIELKKFENWKIWKFESYIWKFERKTHVISIKNNSGSLEYLAGNSTIIPKEE